MNTILKSMILAAGAMAVTAGTASAGTPVVNKRQNAQAHSIYNGVANGRLTFNETKRLVHGQKRVRRIEARAKSDGVVTPLERVRLNTALTVQRLRIYGLKHN